MTSIVSKPQPATPKRVGMDRGSDLPASSTDRISAAPGLDEMEGSSGDYVRENDDRSSTNARQQNQEPATKPSSPEENITGQGKRINAPIRKRCSQSDSCSSNNSSADDRSSSDQRRRDRAENRHHEQELQDAVAISSALVGENILDSPSGMNLRKKRVQVQATAVAKMRENLAASKSSALERQGGTDVDVPLTSGIPSPPTSLTLMPLHSASQSKTFNATMSGSVGTQQRQETAISQSTQQEGSWQETRTNTVWTTGENSTKGRSPAAGVGTSRDFDRTNPALSSSRQEIDASVSAGIMAHGLAWVQRQRDRRRRVYLQTQAERQLEKLRQAQMAERLAREFREQQERSSLTENPTFQTLAKAFRTFTFIEPDDSETNRGGGISSAGSSDYGDSIGPYDEDEVGNNCNAVVSQSGEGYSGNIPISDSENEEEDAAWIPPVRVAEEHEAPPFILSPELMQQIAHLVLPRGISYCKWSRLYSLARDGDSFDTCLRLIGEDRQSLVVVRTSRNAILGGFADMSWSLQHNGGYYGGPNSCLWNVDPEHPNKIVVYRWSGANRYIQLLDSSHKMLAFGGGEDDGSAEHGGGAHFGLSVEQDFQIGSTGPCATFHNAPLCDQETFEIIDLEIYGFLIGQF